MVIIQEINQYFHNVTIVKKLGDTIEIKKMNVLCNNFDNSVDLPNFLSFSRLKKNKKKNITKNYSKFENSIIRAKRVIYEYSLCNHWDYFVTLTIDPARYDRYNLKQYYNDFGNFLKEFNRYHSSNIKYLLIPEKHKSGAWHMHGLISGDINDFLSPFSFSFSLPRYIRNKLINGCQVFSFVPYSKKFGYNVFEPVFNSFACGRYIIKYITKDLSRAVSDVGAHLYYCSRGLQRAEVLAKGVYAGSPVYDYSNNYCSISTYTYSDEFAELIKSKIVPLIQ